jgi:succinate-semialdehyde dehydrogenase/glutarate-semialdehyde dehydrogenase
MITRKAGPALAAGCMVVLKPNNLTLLMVVVLSILAKQAGIPRVVFEVVMANALLTRGVGKEMCMNATVRKVLFMGSTPVGKLLMKLNSDMVKQLSLELGSNAVFIGGPPNAALTCTLNLKKHTLLKPMFFLG